MKGALIAFVSNKHEIKLFKAENVSRRFTQKNFSQISVNLLKLKIRETLREIRENLREPFFPRRSA
jgi:hypothetical protein